MDRWVDEYMLANHSSSCVFKDYKTSDRETLIGFSPKVTRLIGIHAGEPRRGKIPDDAKFHYRFPLKEWDWHQQDCESAIVRAGLSVPVKSACFFCPAMRKVEVIQLSKTHPKLFERAVEMERQANEAGNLQTVKGLGRHWRWEALVKTREVFQYSVIHVNCSDLSNLKVLACTGLVVGRVPDPIGFRWSFPWVPMGSRRG